MFKRIDRISEEMKREISSLISSELKDPRLSGLISVISVDAAQDLKTAKVYVSVLGSESDRTSVMIALRSASGFIRREIGRRMKIRLTPELTFIPDTSIEHGVYISKLIDDTIKKE
jgi:ribosome-binding factor A